MINSFEKGTLLLKSLGEVINFLWEELFILMGWRIHIFLNRRNIIMKKFVCSVCGYVHEGEAAPDFCPICKAPASKFIEKNDNGLTVNYSPAIASLGGSQENSEEEYLILKMMRSLGVIAIDNQARV